MAIRETELPGVGTKYTVELATGEELVVVEHRAGHFEIAKLSSDGETQPVLALQSREANEVGRILTHAAASTEERRKQMLFEQFGIEWVRLQEGSPLVDQTLLDSEIRTKSGANVIAILRGEESIASPRPDTRLRAGDTLVVMGQREQIDTFLRIFSNVPPSE